MTHPKKYISCFCIKFTLPSSLKQTRCIFMFCKDKQIGLNSGDQALHPEAAVLFSHRVCATEELNQTSGFNFSVFLALYCTVIV